MKGGKGSFLFLIMEIALTLTLVFSGGGGELEFHFKRFNRGSPIGDDIARRLMGGGGGGPRRDEGRPPRDPDPAHHHLQKIQNGDAGGRAESSSRQCKLCNVLYVVAFLEHRICEC